MDELIKIRNFICNKLKIRFAELELKITFPNPTVIILVNEKCIIEIEYLKLIQYVNEWDTDFEIKLKENYGKHV